MIYGPKTKFHNLNTTYKHGNFRGGPKNKTKTAYTLRVKRLLKSRRAQQAASNIALGFKRVCKQVVANKGAASKA